MPHIDKRTGERRTGAARRDLRQVHRNDERHPRLHHAGRGVRPQIRTIEPFVDEIRTFRERRRDDDDEFVDVDDEEDEGDVGELLEPHPRNPTATTDPNAYKTSRRPTANSSESFMIPLPLLRVLPLLTPGNARLAGNVDARLNTAEVADNSAPTSASVAFS